MGELAGPDIHYASSDSLCVQAKVSVPLECLVESLSVARVQSVVLVHFGMKRTLHYYDAISQHANLTSICPNRYNLDYNICNNTIPALTSPVATVRAMYVEAGRGGGSLEIHDNIMGIDATIKVYPLVMYPLKITCFC